MSFCSILAIGGAALVVRSVDIQGVITGIFLVFGLGTLLNVSEQDNRDRIYRSAVVGLFFLAAAGLIFLLTGVGLSGYVPPGQATGVDFSKIPIRAGVLFDPYIGGAHVAIGAFTSAAVWMASVAKTETIKHLVDLRKISKEDVASFRFKYEALLGLATTLATIISSFAF